MIRRAGPLGVRLVDLGGRPSDRAHSAYELRQLPDRSLPHPAIVARRPRRWRCSPTAFLAGSGRRREPQRARGRAWLAIVDIRHEMFVKAIEIIRTLFDGAGT